MAKMRTAWESSYRPFIEPVRSQETITTYSCTVKAWEEFTDDPDLMQATATTFSGFAAAALEAGRAAATVNRYLREIRAIVRFEFAEGRLDRMPIIRSVREPERSKWRPSVEEVGRLYAGVRCADLSWPEGPEDFRRDWWESFFVNGYVGALRRSELLRINPEHCTKDGIELYAPKTERLSFVAGIPSVRKHLRRMRVWWSRGIGLGLARNFARRQFYRSVRAIEVASGVRWNPHALKRASIDAWFQVDQTAGTIVGHGRRSVACRNYLDRKQYLLSRAPSLVIPVEFKTDSRQLRLF